MENTLDDWKPHVMGHYNNITDFGLADEAKSFGENAQNGVEMLIEVVKKQQEIIDRQEYAIRSLNNRIASLENGWGVACE